MTLDNVIAALYAVQTLEARVRFDFGGCYPTSVDSWRGVYSEPALGFDCKGNAPTVQELLRELQRSVGSLVEGWKGGLFTIKGASTLHVDNPGTCSHTEITSIQDLEYEIIIHTECTEK